MNNNIKETHLLKNQNELDGWVTKKFRNIQNSPKLNVNAGTRCFFIIFGNNFGKVSNLPKYLENSYLTI